jgi:hypothetical protein
MTDYIIFKLSKCSATIVLSSHPTLLLTTFLMEVYGDINISAPGRYYDAKNDAGPLPIDLPNRSKSFSSRPDISYRMNL